MTDYNLSYNYDDRIYLNSSCKLNSTFNNSYAKRYSRYNPDNSFQLSYNNNNELITNDQNTLYSSRQQIEHLKNELFEYKRSNRKLNSLLQLKEVENSNISNKYKYLSEEYTTLLLKHNQSEQIRLEQERINDSLRKEVDTLRNKLKININSNIEKNEDSNSNSSNDKSQIIKAKNLLEKSTVKMKLKKTVKDIISLMSEELNNEFKNKSFSTKKKILNNSYKKYDSNKITDINKTNYTSRAERDRLKQEENKKKIQEYKEKNKKIKNVKKQKI